eukprot:6729536-Pyramimonas_sp.AAC.1
MRFMFARYLKPTPTFSSSTNIILESEGRPSGSREENSCIHLEFDEGVSELWGPIPSNWNPNTGPIG